MISACQALFDSISVWEMPAAKSPLTASTHCSYIILCIFALRADGEQQDISYLLQASHCCGLESAQSPHMAQSKPKMLENAVDSSLLKKYRVTSWQFEKKN